MYELFILIHYRNKDTHIGNHMVLFDLFDCSRYPKVDVVKEFHLCYALHWAEILTGLNNLKIENLKRLE